MTQLILWAATVWWATMVSALPLLGAGGSPPATEPYWSDSLAADDFDTLQYELHAIDGDRLFVTYRRYYAGNPVVFAVDLLDGSVEWTLQIEDDSLIQLGHEILPVAEADALFLGAYRYFPLPSHLARIDPNVGTIETVRTFDGFAGGVSHPSASPFIYHATLQTGEVLALDPMTLETQWRFDLGMPARIFPSESVLIATGTDSSGTPFTKGFDRDTSLELWSTALPVPASASLANENLLLVSVGTSSSAIYTKNGAPAWSNSDNRGELAHVYAPDGNVLYRLGSAFCTLSQYCLDVSAVHVATGYTLWDYHINNAIGFALSISPDSSTLALSMREVNVSGASPQTVVLDTSSGTERIRLPQKSLHTTLPSVGGLTTLGAGFDSSSANVCTIGNDGDFGRLVMESIDDGTRLWKTELDQITPFQDSRPFAVGVAGNRFVVSSTGTSQRTIGGSASRSGTNWSSDNGGPRGDVEAVSPNKQIVLLSRSGKIVAVEPVHGEILWSVVGPTAAAFSPDGATVFLARILKQSGEQLPEIRAVRAATGEQLWTRSYDGSLLMNLESLRADPSGRMLIASGDLLQSFGTDRQGFVLAVSTTAGEESWRRYDGPEVFAPPGNPIPGELEYFNAIALEHRVLVQGTFDPDAGPSGSGFVAYDLDHGTALWSMTRKPGTDTGAGATPDGSVLVTLEKGPSIGNGTGAALIAMGIDTITGDELWSRTLAFENAQFQSSFNWRYPVAFVPETYLVLLGGARAFDHEFGPNILMYALDWRTGEVVREFRAPERTTMGLSTIAVSQESIYVFGLNQLAPTAGLLFGSGTIHAAAYSIASLK